MLRKSDAAKLRVTASQLKALKSEFRSKLMGSDGIATTRVADSPLPRSSTVSIVLFWKLDN